MPNRTRSRTARASATPSGTRVPRISSGRWLSIHWATKRGGGAQPQAGPEDLVGKHFHAIVLAEGTHGLFVQRAAIDLRQYRAVLQSFDGYDRFYGVLAAGRLGKPAQIRLVQEHAGRGFACEQLVPGVKIRKGVQRGGELQLQGFARDSGVVLESIQQDLVDQGFHLSPQKTHRAMARYTSAKNHHIGVALLLLHEQSGANETGKLVGEVIPVLIDDGQVAMLPFTQHVSHPAAQGDELAAVYIG